MLRLLGPVIAGAFMLAAQDARAQERIELDLGNGVSLPVVRVPAGTFTMGSSPAEPGRKDDEAEHEVTLTQDFYAGVTPVTRGQFARFVAETGHRTEAETGTSGGHGWDGTRLVQNARYTWKDPGFPQTDAHPVVLVTYEDALAFTRWLSDKTGRNVALPTEAQWEYAARGKTLTPWFAAETSRKALDLGWFRENAGGGTHEVMLRPANGFGLHDPAGSVWEWCLDWYGPYPSGSAIDPLVASPPAGETPRRVLRGGSWLTSVDKARSAARYRNTPGSRNADNGFRVVASVEALRATSGVDLPAIPPPPTLGSIDPSSPQAPAAPTRTTPDDSAEDSASSGSYGSDSNNAALGWFLLLGGLGAAGVVFVARGRSRQPSAHGSLSVRPSADGFWIDRPLAAGALVQWSARLGGVVQAGQIEATGGPLFVYTGQRPEEVHASIIASDDRSAASSGAGVHGDHGTPSGATDAWSQQERDAHAQATTAGLAYHAASGAASHGASEASSSSGAASEPFGGWPSAY